MESSLLYWAVVFLVLSLAAGIFGFGAIAGITFSIGKLLAVVFLVLFVVSLVAHAVRSV
jgi:uncharacterized membrane protein YtjA (UPF0391 family)